MGIVDRLRRRLPSPGPRIVLSEGGDSRIVDAAVRIGAAGFARPLLFADQAVIDAAAGRLGVQPDGVVPVVADEERSPETVDRYADKRGVPVAVARRILQRPEALAAAMIEAGRAETMIAGATTSTREVLMACSGVFGLADGVRAPSSFFVIETPDGRGFVFADCAVNPDPSASELAETARLTAGNARVLLGREPRVAMLSLRLKGSGDDAPDAQGDGVWLGRCPPHMWLGRNGRLVALDALATYSDLLRTVAV